MNSNRAIFDNSRRVVIPAEYRKALGVKAGDQVSVTPEDNAVRLVTKEQAIREAQEIAEGFVAPGASLVDELLQERRREAARE